MCSEETNRVLIRANRNSIEQLRRDEDALAHMVVVQQSEIARIQARLNEQDAIIAVLCQDLGIVPKEVQR